MYNIKYEKFYLRGFAMNRKTARENAFILLFEKAIKTDETFEEIFIKATEERELEVDDYVKEVFFGNAEKDVRLLCGHRFRRLHWQACHIR